MGFVLFTAKKSRGYEPKVSIRFTGQIYFNVGAIARYKLSGYKYAQLYYDNEDGKIGIKVTNDENAEGKRRLIIRKEESAWISAKNFFDFFQIKLPKEKKVQPNIEYKSDMIILNYPGKAQNEENNLEIF